MPGAFSAHRAREQHYIFRKLACSYLSHIPDTTPRYTCGHDHWHSNMNRPPPHWLPLGWTLPSRANVTEALLVAAGFIVLGMTLSGVAVRKDYQIAMATDVVFMPGQEPEGRFVTVKLPDQTDPNDLNPPPPGPVTMILGTQDRLLIVKPGAPVCVARHQMLLGRWVTWHLALPGYCALRNQPVASTG